MGSGAACSRSPIRPAVRAALIYPMPPPCTCQAQKRPYERRPRHRRHQPTTLNETYASFLAISSSRISFTVKAIMLLPERRKKARIASNPWHAAGGGSVRASGIPVGNSGNSGDIELISFFRLRPRLAGGDRGGRDARAGPGASRDAAGTASEFRGRTTCFPQRLVIVKYFGSIRRGSPLEKANPFDSAALRSPRPCSGQAGQAAREMPPHPKLSRSTQRLSTGHEGKGRKRRRLGRPR